MKTQKELKQIYIEELKKVWHNDDKMVKHCSSDTAYIIPYFGGLFSIKKPLIKTSFCFGYGQNGISTEEDYRDAERMAEAAKKKQDYFMRKNLTDINYSIKLLKQVREEMGYNWADGSYPHFAIVKRTQKYYSQPEDCTLMGWNFCNTYNGIPSDAEIVKDITFIDELIKGHEEVRQDFIKRLNSYLKRYGMTKVRTWSYLSD